MLVTGRAAKTCSWRDPDRESIKCRKTAVLAPNGEDFRCEEHWRKSWNGASDKRRRVPALKFAEKEFIRERDHRTCALCGADGNEVDHIVEVADGGTNLPSNLQTLCHNCHSDKTRRSQTQWAQSSTTRTSARNAAKKRRRRMGLYQQ
jgi:5-methylcytosine-specific restriction endonuclease McrA